MSVYDVKRPERVLDVWNGKPVPSSSDVKCRVGIEGEGMADP